MLAVIAALSRVADAAAQQWVGKTTLVIGGAGDARDDYQFEHVRGMHIFADGRVAVADAVSNSVRLFDGKGQLVGLAGQRGQGPGDLARPCCVTQGKDGLLWLFEEGNVRFSAFRVEPGGLRYVKTIRAPPGTDQTGAAAVRWSSRGNLLAYRSIPGAGPADRRVVRQEIDDRGTVLRADTMASVPMVIGKAIELRRPGSSPTSFATTTLFPPFAPGTLQAFGPDGEVATAVSSGYRIEWREANGRLRAVITGTGTGPLVTAKEAADARDYFGQRSREFHTDIDFAIPDRKPVLAAIGFDQEGRLWVMRSVEPGAAKVSDLYGRDGKLIAHVIWPPGVSVGVFAATGRQAFATMADADGTRSVVRVEFR